MKTPDSTTQSADLVEKVNESDIGYICYVAITYATQIIGQANEPTLRAALAEELANRNHKTMVTKLCASLRALGVDPDVPKAEANASASAG